jgi:DNA-directed RNA polymerase I, II, and III subunit RPABC2
MVESFKDIKENYDTSKYISRNVLTKFEKTKIIGSRMEQLARGATPYVSTTGLNDIKSIVMREMDEKKIPFIITRSLPNGKKEHWKLKDLYY